MSYGHLDAAVPSDPGTNLPPSLLRFWRPQYWGAWPLVAMLWLTAALPWRVGIKVYKRLGLMLRPLVPRLQTLVERNIAMYFPELGQAEIAGLARAHFQSLGACLAEAAYAWFGRVDDSLTEFHIEGDDLVNSALEAGRGVILYTGHFTSIEICGPAVKKLFPKVGIMFHPRRNPLLNEIQRRGRQHSGHFSFADNDLRAMLRALRQNAVVWYATDQSHSHHAHRVHRYGDEAASAETTTCRIARISGAAVVALSYYRLPDDSGYVLRFGPKIDDFPADEDPARAEELSRIVQTLIFQCPEQYGWTYKRLRKPNARSFTGETHSETGQI